jgi:hypothetical protein
MSNEVPESITRSRFLSTAETRRQGSIASPVTLGITVVTVPNANSKWMIVYAADADIWVRTGSEAACE